MIMYEWNVAFLISTNILESQSMQPNAESDKVGSLAAQNICLKNQHIKINVVVTQTFLDFCNI